MVLSMETDSEKLSKGPSSTGEINSATTHFVLPKYFVYGLVGVIIILASLVTYLGVSLHKCYYNTSSEVFNISLMLCFSLILILCRLMLVGYHKKEWYRFGMHIVKLNL